MVNLFLILLAIVVFFLGELVDTYFWRLALHANDVYESSLVQLWLVQLTSRTLGLFIPGGSVVVESSLKIKFGQSRFTSPHTTELSERILSSVTFTILIASVGSIPVLLIMIGLLILQFSWSTDITLILLTIVIHGNSPS